MTKTGKPEKTKVQDQHPSHKMTFTSTLNTTSGFMVGFTLGYPLGTITATERLVKELNWLRQLMQLHHDDPQARKEIKKRMGLISLMIVGAPVYFGAAPFWGAARGAQIGAHAGLVHSFGDVTNEAIKITPRLNKIEGYYYTDLPPTCFYKERKASRDAKKAEKQVNSYFDIEDQESKKARKKYGLFSSFCPKASSKKLKGIEYVPLVDKQYRK